MRVPVVIAIVLALLALMSCVLQTPEPEETSAPETTETATPAAAATGNTPAAATATPAFTPSATSRVSGSRTSYSGSPAMTLDPESDYVANFRTNQGNFTVKLFATPNAGNGQQLRIPGPAGIL